MTKISKLSNKQTQLSPCIIRFHTDSIMFTKIRNDIHDTNDMYTKTQNRVHIRSNMYTKTQNRTHNNCN